MRVIIYALTIKLESKCGLFQSFSFCYIVRITRFPRESLADLCLFDLKRSQVDHLRLISSRPKCWTLRLVPYHFTQPPNRWRCYEIFSWNLRFNHAVSCIYTRLIQKPTTRKDPFQPSQSEFLRPRLTALCRDCECSPTQFLLANLIGTVVVRFISLMFSQDYHLCFERFTPEVLNCRKVWFRFRVERDTFSIQSARLLRVRCLKT